MYYTRNNNFRRHLHILRQVPLFLTAIALCAAVASSAFAAAEADPVTPTLSDNTSLYMAYADSADIYISRQKWDLAENMIRKALRTSPANPGNPLLFANLGVCLSQQSKYGEALEAFEIGLIKAPRSTAILSSRALTYLAMNREDDALADLQTALKEDSTLRRPLRIAGQILLAKGDIAGARARFSSLTKIHPSDPWGPRGLAHCAEAEGIIAEALPLYRDALSIEKDPENQADLHVAIIRSLISLDRLNDADDAVRQAIASFPRCGEIYLMRAMLHHLRFQYEDEKIDKKLAIEYGVDPQIVERLFPTE